MKTVAIVQARLGSTRLPAKVLANLHGDTMLSRVVSRVRAARTVDECVIATTTHASDEPIVREAARLGVGCFRGSETDVLARYVGAAREFGADVVVRVTSDCPLLDPEVVDRVVRTLRVPAGCDYASNTHRRTYPRGLDVEAMTLRTLERFDERATTAPAREHVTAYLMIRPELFAIRQVYATSDDSDLRFTVDTSEDLALVRALYQELDLDVTIAPYADVVAAARERPDLVALNAHIEQKTWHGGRVA